MSLEELEKRVQQLPTRDLAKFAEWFDVFREATVVAGEGDVGEVAEVQKEELLRRRAEYLANPSLATPWDDGFFERLCQRLGDARAQKAPSR